MKTIRHTPRLGTLAALLLAVATAVLFAAAPASAAPVGTAKPASTQDAVLSAYASNMLDGCSVSTHASWVRATNEASITTEVTNPQTFHSCRVAIQLQFRLSGNGFQDDPQVHTVLACSKADWTCPSYERVAWHEQGSLQPSNLVPLAEQLTIDQRSL